MKYKDKRGFALIITIWVMFFITALAISVAYMTRLELKKSAYQVNKLKAFYLARAGLEEAVSVLYQNKGKIPPEFNDEHPDLYNRRALGEGYYWVNIEDENAKLNINMVSDDRLNSLGTMQQLVNREELVDSIFDWLDLDSISRTYGAEDFYYQFLDPSYHVKNGRLDTIEEMRLIKGVNDNNFYILKKYLTIATNDDKININTAPLEVLKTLPGFNVELAEKFFYSRGVYQLRNKNELRDFFGEEIYKQIGNLVTFNSDTFRITCNAYVGNVHKEVQAIVKISNMSYRITWWQER
jgi:general secretion pathway protein K